MKVLDGHRAKLEVVVQRVVSALDTGAIHGRGCGVLLRDRTVEVRFLLQHADFQRLRQDILAGQGEVTFSVHLRDVTAVDVNSPRSSASWPCSARS